MDEPPPPSLIDWQGEPWTPATRPGRASEQPLHRAARQLPVDRRRTGRTRRACRSPPSSSAAGGARLAPLVYQAFDWEHGVFLGATMGSETTAAATGAVGMVRRDPMAMLPFCGYNMGDYFGHWLEMGRRVPSPPAIFHVNWFRKDAAGPLPLAGLRREHARAALDHRPRGGPRRRRRRRSASCPRRTRSTWQASISPRTSASTA